MTSSESLSQIALSVGFSDQSHFSKRFRQALGQSPSNWRREREELFGAPWRRLPEKQGPKVRPLQIVDRQQAREKLHENRSNPQPVSSSSGLSSPRPAMERHMRVIETFPGPAQFPTYIRFVVVNNRVPQADALCALCGTKIEQSYVHELQARSLYCDAHCLAGYQKKMVPARARRVR